MCSEKKFLHVAYILLVTLMASLLFTVSVLNHSKLKNMVDENKIIVNKIDHLINTENENKVIVNKIEKVNSEKVSSVCTNLLTKFEIANQNKQYMLKNEFSKIEEKLIQAIKSGHEIGNKKKNSEQQELVINKLDNLLEIMERIYDYVSLNENSRLTDNYNFYNLIKNQVIQYIDVKIEELINKMYKKEK